MSFNYHRVLQQIRDARGKSKKGTKKFIAALNRIDQAMPNYCNTDFFSRDQNLAHQDDLYSEGLLMRYGPLEEAVGRAAKLVTGNGNCLFNSASVALIGKPMSL